MRSYLSLVPVSARVHRRQSRMTRICIILAVFLVTAIFSITDIWMTSQTDAMRDKHGNYHILLQNIAKTEAELIGRRSDIACTAWCDEINQDADGTYAVNGRETVLYGVEEPYVTDIRMYLTEGVFPRNDKEVLLSVDAKELFGTHTGDTITLNTPVGNFDYAVAGFCKDDTEFNRSFDGCCIYMNMTAFGRIRSCVGENTSPKYYIRFTEKTNLRKAIADLREQYGLTDENIDENTAVLGLSGASSNKTVTSIYPLAAICFLLILLSGILMISGCINSNVAQRTGFFGMLRCIGASRQQIGRYVRLEAFNWCITAIPAGCALGIVTTWILCAILRLLVQGEWAYMRLFGVSIPSILCGVAVGLVTVFFAAYSPAKRAAKVSPVLAVSGNTEAAKNISHAANTRFLKVETSLGIHHAVSDRKNLILIAGSFALTIVLFLTFSCCLDFARRLLPSLSDFSPDVAVAAQDGSNSIDRSLVADIAKIPGVQNVFGTMYSVGIPARINGKDTVIDLISYEEFMFSNTKKSVASGKLSKVYGDSGYAMTIFSRDSKLDVGDKVTIGDHELEIACVASEGIGSISGSPVVVCSEETFMRLTGEQSYTMVNIILGREQTETTIRAIRDLAGANAFVDRREEDKEIYSSYWVIRLAAYGFLAIISLIAVLNIMNSISMSVSARIRQYGAMRAIGMEGRQVKRMITAEAVTYAICGTIFGDIFGLILHYTFYDKIIMTHFGGGWKFPVIPLGIVALMVSVSCAVAVYGPAKRIRRMAITETINEL